MSGGKDLRRFVTYALVGAAGTGAQYAALIVFVHTGVLSPSVASCCGALLGAAINYALNYRFTFRENRNHATAAPRFFVVAAVAILANWVGMIVLCSALGLNYLAAQVMTTASVLAITYVANATWSFRAPART